MSLFQDKKFEELDWLSQITETIESDINTILAAMPDEIQLTYEDVAEIFTDGYCSTRRLTADKFLKNILRRTCTAKDINLPYEDENNIVSCFSFEVADNTIFNVEDQTLTGAISLVKHKFTFDEEFLQKGMGKDAEFLYWTKISRSPSRAREIARLLDVNVSQEILRSNRRLGSFITNTMRRILATNEWRIRSTDLANKACNWIQRYIEDNCKASYSNFCRLKVMTHSGGPIYSIEEEK